MGGVTQINLVVSDVERSRAFYAALGCEMRPITVPGDETPRAWEVTSGFAPIGIHTIHTIGNAQVLTEPVAHGTSSRRGPVVGCC